MENDPFLSIITPEPDITTEGEFNLTKNIANIKYDAGARFFSHKNQLFPIGASLTSTEPSSASKKILLLFHQDIDLVNS